MRTEENLPEDKKTARKLFVLEYLKDFNATKALLRLGQEGTIQYVRKKGSEYLREPYVNQLIDEHIRQAKEDTIVTRAEVLFGLKNEAHNAPEAATRVTAWCNIGKMLGMYVEKKELKVTGSGVMLIPASASPDEWEAATSAAQEHLKAAAAAEADSHGS